MPRTLSRTLLRTVCVAMGPEGMIGGQALDLLYEKKRVSFPRVLAMHRRKTGMLIRGALLVGAQVAGANATLLRRFASYGDRIGVAFQIVDDLLNESSTRKAVGKSVRSDRARVAARSHLTPTTTTFSSATACATSRTRSEWKACCAGTIAA